MFWLLELDEIDNFKLTCQINQLSVVVSFVLFSDKIVQYLRCQVAVWFWLFYDCFIVICQLNDCFMSILSQLQT